MGKPKIPSQKSRYASLNQRLNKYLLLVQQIFDDLNLEAAKAATSVSYDTDAGRPFRFSDFPTLKKRVEDLRQRYVDDIGAVIYSGISSEWKKSNEVQDLLASGVLKAYGADVHGERFKIYYEPNNDAMKAFQKRRANGRTLSQKLWNQSRNYTEEMEYAISSAIEKGTSAVTLSKRLSKYLHDFPSLQKDYKDKYGKAVECHDCEYRSMRLARSEINMAYRTAEQERWAEMDFVVGYEIKLSGSHPAEDICDILKGKYPKDFVWTGWHPNDMCYKIPILKTEEEFWEVGDARFKPSVNEVKDVPVAFREWVEKNALRISMMEKRGTLPYFLKDNVGYVKMDDVKALRDKLMANFSLLPSEDRDEVLTLFASHPTASEVMSSMQGIASRLEGSLSTYESWAYTESPVIAKMLDRLYSPEMQKGDPMARVRLVSEIKEKVAVLTRWRLRQCGAIDGLEYVGLKKNNTIFPKSTLYAKNIDEYITVPAYKLDMVVFKDKYGKEFSYRLGSRESNIPFKASDASRIIHDFPQEMQEAFKGILFDFRPHTLEQFHSRVYKSLGRSAAYSGEPISFHIKVEESEFKQYLSHEIAHHLDKGISLSKKWKDAIRLDNNFVSGYAMENELEDFAETFANAFRFLSDPTMTWDEFEHAVDLVYPNRWKILRGIFEEMFKDKRR